MDTAVALVGAYLRFNGYISLPEQPILVGEGRPWRYYTATDLDLLAVRLPNAAVVVPRDDGAGGADDQDLRIEPDPILDLHDGTVDVLVAEVKEGRPRLNDALRSPRVLEAALRRLDAGFDESFERIVGRLIRDGETTCTAGGYRWRFRLVAFGDGEAVAEGGPFRAIPLRHAARFLIRCMAEHRRVWRDAQFGDTVLDLLHLLDKIGLGEAWMESQDRRRASARRRRGASRALAPAGELGLATVGGTRTREEPRRGMATVTLKIAGMSCSHCEEAVANALRRVDGVWEARVDLATGRARVDYDETRTDVETLVGAVMDEGYTAEALP